MDGRENPIWPDESSAAMPVMTSAPFLRPGVSFAQCGGAPLEPTLSLRQALGILCLTGPGCRQWPRVVNALSRATDRSADPIEALRGAGLWAEASILGSFTATCSHVSGLQHPFYCALDDGFPRSWLRRLGVSSPGALWSRGAAPVAGLPWYGVVGSRQPDSQSSDMAVRLGREIADSGAVVVTGGAPGVDTLAAAAALAAGGSVVEILPAGFDRGFGLDLERFNRAQYGLQLAFSQDEDFSAARAMQRNALIYAGTRATFVVGPRVKTGGTWAGASDALRRRLTTVIVTDPTQVADRMLIALGANPMPADPPLLVATERIIKGAPAPLQPSLFGISSGG